MDHDAIICFMIDRLEVQIKMFTPAVVGPKATSYNVDVIYL